MVDALWHGWGMYSWLIVGVVVVVVVFVLAGRKKTPSSESDREILRRRYAAGEIDDEELEHRLGLLQGRNRRT